MDLSFGDLFQTEMVNMNFSRIKNRLIAKIITQYPALSRMFIDSYKPWEFDDIPWSPVSKPLNESKIAIVTTSGVHYKDQTPFDMSDKDGDPTFRVIDSGKSTGDLIITHDYYDHKDAESDINIIFPAERLLEFQKEKVIGELAGNNFSFMGHIDGRHIPTLINESAADVAQKLISDHVDCVLLTPG